MQRFEKQAGLTDTGYTPHKGLSAEETRYHRLAESMHVSRDPQFNRLKSQSDLTSPKQFLLMYKLCVLDIVEASNAKRRCQRRETAIVWSVNACRDPSVLTQAETQVLNESAASHPLFCINQIVG